MFQRTRTYLDFAAGALPNPSSPHAEGRRERARLEAARERVARLLECKSDDVIFTSGATQANALAVLGTATAARGGISHPPQPTTHQPHFLYLPSAHASITENMTLAATRFRVVAEPLPIRGAQVDTVALAKLLRPETVLVSMDAVCGETGVMWNTRAVRAALDAARPLAAPRILLHVDASHAPYVSNLTRAHFGADLLTLDGGKLGVRGVGALVAHRTIPLAPLYAGGGQERGLLSGTENVEAVERFAKQLAEAAGKREAFLARASRARSVLLSSITTIPGIAVNEGQHQAPRIVNISLPGRDTDYLVALLDEEGFAVSTRSACETDSEEGSRAVFALYGDRERARTTLRISFGPNVSQYALRRFSRALMRAVAFIDENALA